jgi:hypothetical protein
MRVTRGKARIYPTVTFEEHPSEYTSMLRSDPVLKHFQFTEIETDFEFLVNSNSFLQVNRAVKPALQQATSWLSRPGD